MPKNILAAQEPDASRNVRLDPLDVIAKALERDEIGLIRDCTLEAVSIVAPKRRRTVLKLLGAAIRDLTQQQE
ncbi:MULTISPECIES: hypothetical protein [unclassified Mesorhizobium]|uniref:hypothetical protein n=1 Tax=unclassified Mesorhizobium TaxID=325217 RepID=UPI000F7644FE|nr:MULTISPECIES: hypothetical protein [unclassified Mesorhizobium]AZO09570.1 hypothetical protein EJ074_10995 [Mesorhizobium sp. M3A.F.Ca.ET.080.04.2.1]RWB65711.1 MAG: hypothetical protein EOQ49_31100 [Mesorhizobium sp.]RWB81565.1 MAG: hypothetical protein EOQ52_29790 [Mesorhizobium sp.]RWE33454.1 MAG: hypothetical protein EOS77_12030 [Mesorhizobium sp.]RWF25601.1 MAG: hypothetical protein EOS64_03945 [Mesorhizobium sp.]